MNENPYEFFLKALCDKSRHRILQSLQEGPKNVTQICQATGLEQTNASHHLRCLTNCGFVDVEQAGKKRIYSLDEQIITPILESIDKHIEKYRDRLKSCEVVR